MADDSRDVLMKLELPGDSFEAECSAVIPSASDDPLVSGFTGTGMMGNLVRGNYFSIEDFTFDAGISEPPASKTNPAEAQDAQTRGYDSATRKETNRAIGAVHDRQHALEQRIVELEGHIADLIAERDGRRSGGRGVGGGGGGGGGGGRRRPRAALAPPNVSTAGSGAGTIPFQRFLLQGRAALRGESGRYPSDLEPITITKRMDISSRLLFDRCATSYVFKSASIIKRKAIGAETLRTYLRLDFTDVMLISLDWNDDDVIKETFKFVCRRAKVRYAIETASADIKKSKSTSVLTAQNAVEWAPAAK